MALIQSSPANNVIRRKFTLSTFNLLNLLVGYEFISSIAPIFLNTQNIDGANRLITVPYHLFTILLSVLVISQKSNIQVKLNKSLKVLFFYWGLLLLRFISDMYLRADIHVDSDVKNRTIAYIIISIIPAYSVLKSIHEIDFSKLLSTTYLLLSFSVLATILTHGELQDVETNVRVNTLTMNTIRVGHLGLTAIVMSLYLFMTEKGIRRLYYTLYIIVGILSLFVMLRSGSRGPLLSMLGIITVLIIGLTKKPLLNMFFLLMAGGLFKMFTSQIMEAISRISPFLYSRFMAKEETGQLAEKYYYYNYAFDAFSENPFWGKYFAVYYGNGQMIYPHNVFLDSLMQIGIIGGVLISVIYFVSFRRVIKLIQVRSPYLWLGLILVQHLVEILVSSSFYYQPLITILLTILLYKRDIQYR